MPVNIEIKARSNRIPAIRSWLQEQGARFAGTDNQTDTYFRVPVGRLKLRQGNVENNLIGYQRPDTAGQRRSDFWICKAEDPAALRTVLANSLGILVEVVKSREIYYIANVKFHLDTVGQLGSFVEIEAGNLLEDLPVEKLEEQCAYYCKVFEIGESDYLNGSYSDMLLALADDHRSE